MARDRVTVGPGSDRWSIYFFATWNSTCKGRNEDGTWQVSQVLPITHIPLLPSLSLSLYLNLFSSFFLMVILGVILSPIS